MKILTAFLLLACLAWQANARAQDDEGRAAPARGGLLKRGNLVKGKATTTTTTPPPQEEEEYEDEDYAAEGEPQEPSTEAPPSSTEGKKLIAGGVRPFRSNTDLLEILKRRRAQAAEAKHGGGSHSTAAVAQSQSQDAPATDAPVKANFSKKRFNTPARDSNSEDAPAQGKPSRSRFGRPSTRAVQEPEPEEQNDAAPPTRTGRGFPGRRGSN